MYQITSNAKSYFSRYTPCIKFRNNETAVLKHEVIKVTCRRRRRHTRKSKIYEDVYIVLKKLKPKQRKKNDNSWNILLLGMDTMSRMRAYRSIPKTVKYFKNNKWLDYRNFLKVNNLQCAFLKINCILKEKHSRMSRNKNIFRSLLKHPR